jgi:hypothetical protein
MIIDAQEGRAVQTFDVPGAYLHADMPKDERLLLKLTGEFVDVMCKVNPEYIPYVRSENGKKVLYLKILKAIYGMIESALLWYELCSTTLEKMGFEINPHDKCVANKIIEGTQCTVCWYVDDNKVSHVNDDVNTTVVNEIEKKFGKLARTTGTKHTFLGMDIEFVGDKKVAVGAPQHIDEAIEDFGEDLDEDAVNPAKSNLFTVNPDSVPLPENKADICHSVVAKLLWVSQRSRPDMELDVSFLCTRAQHPTVEDSGELRRGLKFLKRTRADRRIMGADDILKFDTCIDASYAAHANMRGHTGGAMSFGWGVAHEKASKQKINTKLLRCSTQDPNDQLSWCTRLQFKEMRPMPRHSECDQNGRNSCTGNSRHISIRHFFVKDRVDKGEFTIEHCPAECMLADYFTKPLQGALFTKFRAVIMGWVHIDTLKNHKMSPPKERVGNSVRGAIAHKTRKSHLDAAMMTK